MLAPARACCLPSSEVQSLLLENVLVSSVSFIADHTAMPSSKWKGGFAVVASSYCAGDCLIMHIDT